MKKFLNTILVVCFIMFGVSSYVLAKHGICKSSKHPAQNLTLIIARHGEKPEPINKDRGVLNCRGENRALHIPWVMKEKFGTIDDVFAPSPHFTKKYGANGEGAYSVRPFQTSLPTATFFNTGINICIDVDHSKDIAKLATSSQHEGKTVLVVWEHKRIKDIAEHINDIYHASYKFDKWDGNDFDTLYIFTVKNGQLNFEKSAEGLNNIINDSCIDMK